MSLKVDIKDLPPSEQTSNLKLKDELQLIARDKIPWDYDNGEDLRQKYFHKVAHPPLSEFLQRVEFFVPQILPEMMNTDVKLKLVGENLRPRTTSETKKYLNE